MRVNIQYHEHLTSSYTIKENIIPSPQQPLAACIVSIIEDQREGRSDVLCALHTSGLHVHISNIAQVLG